MLIERLRLVDFLSNMFDIVSRMLCILAWLILVILPFDTLQKLKQLPVSWSCTRYFAVVAYILMVDSLFESSYIEEHVYQFLAGLNCSNGSYDFYKVTNHRFISWSEVALLSRNLRWLDGFGWLRACLKAHTLKYMYTNFWRDWMTQTEDMTFTRSKFCQKWQNGLL